MYSYEFNLKIRQYIDGEISLIELEEWYTPRLKSLLAYPDSDQAQMIGEIEMGMVELSNKTITEEELRKRIREKLSPTILITYWPERDNAIITSGSGNVTIQTNMVFPSTLDQPALVIIR